MVRSLKPTLAIPFPHASCAHARPCATLRRRVHQDSIIGVPLDVLLEILRPLERLAAENAFVWLEWHVNADVRGEMVALHGGGAASTPLARQVEIVGALATDMALADVVLVEGVSTYRSFGSKSALGSLT